MTAREAVRRIEVIPLPVEPSHDRFRSPRPVDDPDLETLLDSRVTYRGEYLTGEVVEMNGDTTVALTTYRDGFEDGPSIEWFADGTKQSEGTVHRGIAVGLWRLWHADGQLAEEKVFDDKGHTLRVRRWSESGEIVKDMVYEQS